VIVTGGSGGIGRGLVLEFAREGANVAIASRDAEQGGKVAEAVQGLPGAVAVMPSDVTDPAAVAALVTQARSACGRSTCS
jgi:NAD(P)-dependent dehydrogenase (short-subunit alcohol dehydrogenase family)